MRSSVRLALFTITFGLLLTEPLPAYAVVSPQPGDTCTGVQTGYFTTNAGSLQQPGLFLICDGSHWNLFQSFTTAGNVGIGTATPNSGSILDLSGSTTSMLLPSGTSAQRPTAANGMVRYNSTVPQVEAYYSGAWQAIGGATTPGTPCTSSTFYNASTNGSTQLVALSSGKIVYICGYTIIAAGTVNVQFTGGTGSNCASGTANLTPAYELTAGTVIVDSSTITRGLQTASSAALCISTKQYVLPCSST